MLDRDTQLPKAYCSIVVMERGNVMLVNDEQLAKALAELEVVHA